MFLNNYCCFDQPSLYLKKKQKKEQPWINNTGRTTKKFTEYDLGGFDFGCGSFFFFEKRSYPKRALSELRLCKRNKFLAENAKGKLQTLWILPAEWFAPKATKTGTTICGTKYWALSAQRRRCVGSRYTIYGRAYVPLFITGKLNSGIVANKNCEKIHYGFWILLSETSVNQGFVQSWRCMNRM